MSADGTFPDPALGGVVVTVLPTDGVTNAYIPPEGFTVSCPLTYYDGNCNTNRYDPQQMNAFEAEMLALAVAMFPTGTWNCGSVTNMANAFTNYASSLELAGLSFATVLNIRIGATEDTVVGPGALAAAALAGLFYPFNVFIVDPTFAGDAAVEVGINSVSNSGAILGAINGSGSGSAITGTINGGGSGWAGNFFNITTGKGINVEGNILASGTITPSDSSLKLNQKAIDDTASIVWSKKLAWVDFIKFHDPQSVENHNDRVMADHEKRHVSNKSSHVQRVKTQEELSAALKRLQEHLGMTQQKLQSASVARKQMEKDSPRDQNKFNELTRRIAALSNHVNDIRKRATKIGLDLKLITEHVTTLAKTIEDHEKTTPAKMNSAIHKDNEAAQLGTQAGLIAQQVQELVTSTGYGDYVMKTTPSGKLALDYMSIFAIVNRGLQLRIAKLEEFLSQVPDSGITV